MSAGTNDNLKRKAMNEYGKAVGRALHRIGQLAVNEASRSMGGAQPSPPGRPPAVGRGLLRRSLTYEVSAGTGAKKDAFVRFGTNLKYGRIQELGGTIMAKGGPYLVFPLLVGSQLQGGAKPKRPGQARTLDGKKLTGLRQGGVHRWIKVRSVTLPPRPYLRPAAHKVGPQVGPILRKECARIKAA